MRVPWVLPIQAGVDVFPGVGRVPAVVRTTLGLKPGLPKEMLQFFLEEGERILARRKPQLLGFYGSANRALQAGIVPVMSRHFQFDEGMATYRANNGTEILDIIIYPDLAYNPRKEEIPVQWTYLELRFEFSIDNGGSSSNVEDNVELPNLNTNRGLITRAKIRKPEKLAKDEFFLRDGGASGNGEPLYHNGQYFPYYDLHHDPRGFISGDNTWCGFDMAEVIGKTSKDFDGAKHEQTYSLDAWDGPLLMAHAGYFTGPTAEKKHYSSYIIDLRQFDNQPFDIELRAYWGGSFYLDPADGSPFPDVKLSYHLWNGGVVHWPQYEEELVAPARGPIELEDRRIPTGSLTFGGSTYSWTYHKLRGASTEGLGGMGGPADTTTYDESENRASDTVFTLPGARVNTPGIYINYTAGGAYDPSQIPPWPQPGYYYWYCPNWSAAYGGVDQIELGPPIRFHREDIGSGGRWFSFPEDFEMAIYQPTVSGGTVTNEWNYGGTIQPREDIFYPKANDYFTHSGGAEKPGVLVKAKQVTYYELSANPGTRNYSFDTPGQYFGNVTYTPATQTVTFSDKKGPDPKLRGGPGGWDDSEFWLSGEP